MLPEQRGHPSRPFVYHICIPTVEIFHLYQYGIERDALERYRYYHEGQPWQS